MGYWHCRYVTESQFREMITRKLKEFKRLIGKAEHEPLLSSLGGYHEYEAFRRLCAESIHSYLENMTNIAFIVISDDRQKMIAEVELHDNDTTEELIDQYYPEAVVTGEEKFYLDLEDELDDEEIPEAFSQCDESMEWGSEYLLQS